MEVVDCAKETDRTLAGKDTIEDAAGYIHSGGDADLFCYIFFENGADIVVILVIDELDGISFIDEGGNLGG